ncbi:hypothetical protein BB559_007270 [Furculomyces boomerangus]|uniref:phosphoinositide 5-phosphatase n=1 Tax=Furculomyces boomerangus TaxID=61424 RepID=A0A2T9XXY7_9FUNG|nr:hypothetical protein BB559_007270 [Furculomyces boomerangus]
MQQFLVFIETRTRSIALVPANQENNPKSIFLHLDLNPNFNSHKKVLVNVKAKSITELSQYECLNINPVFGIAGVLEYEKDVFVILVSKAELIPDCEMNIYKVSKVKLLSLTNPNYDYTFESNYPDLQSEYGNDSQGYGNGYLDGNNNSYLEKGYGDKQKNQYDSTFYHPCSSLINFLERGNLYFSQVYDISKSAQEQELDKQSQINIRKDKIENKSRYMARNKKSRYCWNENMLKIFYQFEQRLDEESFTKYSKYKFTIPLIQGFVGFVQRRYSANQNDMLNIMLISRLNARRTGTRFLTRGIDDTGNVANFCQRLLCTQILGYLAMYRYEEVFPFFGINRQGFQIGAHKLQLVRTLEASIPAAKKHFSSLISTYGKVHIVSLVKASYGGQSNETSMEYFDSIYSNNTIGESELGKGFELLVKKLDVDSMIGFTGFDFHEMVKGNQYGNLGSLIHSLVSVIDKQRFFFKRIGENEKIESYQIGVIRTNCLDCLDRTNVVQSEIAKYVSFLVLSQYLSREIGINSTDTESELRWLFGNSGNALSIIYTGTSALKAEVTVSGKSGFAGFLNDASKSIGRFVQGNFSDKNKQAVIDTMAGNMIKKGEVRDLIYNDPNFDLFKKSLKEYLIKSKGSKKLSIFTSTFNCAGTKYGGQNLDKWFGDASLQRPDILLVSMQEIVKLNVSSVISAATTNRVVWIDSIIKYMNSNTGNDLEDKYVLISTEQLVGICAIIIAKTSVLDLITDIELVKVKTGLVGGLSGNKGAIGVKMNVGHRNSVCFVAAHLASGAGKDMDRNYDYNFISNSLPMALNSDLVIWAGDLNYRLDLPSSYDAQVLIEKRNIQSLLLYDQLSYHMNSNLVFTGGFVEMPIKFMPTYKFNSGTNQYDTNTDPPRVPSYTDRILYKFKGHKSHFQPVNYYCGDGFLMSDHKPVCASFFLTVDYDTVALSYPNSSIIHKLACFDVLEKGHSIHI